MKRAAAVLIALVGATPPASSGEPDVVSPYLDRHVELDFADQAARLHASAEAATDPATAARYVAIECWMRTSVAFDATVQVAPCPRARALAAELHLADLDAYLALIEGNLAAWSLDIPRAVDRLGAAITLGAGLDPAAPEAIAVRSAHFTLGAILIEGGMYDQARRELSLSRDQAEAAGDVPAVAWADTWLCRLHDLTSERALAHEHCARAQAYVDVAHDWLLDASLSWMIGNLAYDEGRLDDALTAYRHGYQQALRPGGALNLPTLRLNIAETLHALGRDAEATPWLDALVRDVDAGALPPMYRQQISAAIGWNRLAAGRFADAIAPFETAIGSAMHSVAITSYTGLAIARGFSGDRAGAITALEDAILRIEADRRSVDGAATRASFMQAHAAIYRELAWLLWDDGRGGERVLEVAEAGRARALLDALSAAQIAGAAAAPQTADEIRHQLAPGEVLVEYVVTYYRTLAIAVTDDEIRVVPLPDAGDAATLAERVGFFRQLVAEAPGEASIVPAATRLYHDLVEPLGLAGARTLIVSPDGPLHELPFDALRGPDGFVVDRWDVAVVPSASVLAARTRRDVAGALIVAAPQDLGGLGALPHVRDEAAAVAARVRAPVQLVGDDATEAALDAADPGKFAILHLASHAVVDDALPLRSAIVLGDGEWRAEEIYQRALGADLVVLSACRTADGAQARGEGVMSLARAFLHAGAGATIATAWDVEDASGPAFADALYRRLGAGADLGAAVAGAKRALKARGALPRAWAAYVLAGSPRATVRDVLAPPPEDRRSLAPSLALLGVGLGVAILALVRRQRSILVLAAGCALGALIAFAVPPSVPAPPAPERIARRGPAVPPVSGDTPARYFTAEGLPLPSPEGAAWALVGAQLHEIR